MITIIMISVTGGGNKNKAMMKAKVLRRMTSDDSDSNEASSGNKENVDTNKAAVVIQSRKYRELSMLGYSTLLCDCSTLIL